MNRDRSVTVLGFLAALAVLAVLFWLVGVGAVVGALADARLPLVALLVPVAAGWLAAWGLALYTVLRALDAPISAPRAVLVFSAAVFSNNVTPFGQAGGEPLSALLISEAADTEYETGLAAIASVDTIHFLPSVGLAAVGLTTVLLGSVAPGRNLRIAAAVVGALVVAIPVAAYLGWRYRYELEGAVVRGLTPLLTTLGRVVPRVDPPTAADIEHRIEGFFEAIDRVAASRTTLLTAVGFSLLGWVGLAGSLWVATLALGHPITYAAAMVVVPVGAIASITPLPGGLGGIEAAFIVLLVSTTGIPAAAASAAVILHRSATYWLPTLVGGATAAALGARRSSQRLDG
ncbi:MAG: YbhN family protein [Halorientalis sp.]